MTASRPGEAPTEGAPIVIGRYAIFDPIAAGGMATVYIGRLLGPVGFARTVAIKRLHPQFASNPDFVSMFLDEARLAARIHHPNVVSTLDVVATKGELFLVMDYVRGEAASALTRYAAETRERIPGRIVGAIVSGALQGLHAAHTATDEEGRPLGIVHRDVSPQNVIVGLDGTPRVLDFGVAKAANRIHTTQGGEIKGKIAYMPPEQLEGLPLDRTADIYSSGLLLFAMLTGQRMFQATEEVASIAKIIRNEIVLPSAVDPSLAAWDPVVRKATMRDPKERYATARAMAVDVEKVIGVAGAVDVADFVERLAGDRIQQRTKRIAEIESVSTSGKALAQAELVKELRESAPRGLGEHESTTSGPPPPRAEQSGVSAISHAVSVRASALLRKKTLPAVAAGFAVGISLLAFFFLRGTTAPSPPLPVAAAPPPTATEPATIPEVTAVPPVTATATPSEPPQLEPPAPTADAPKPASAAPRAHARSVAPRPAASKPNCDHPTTVDSQGHVHFRPECL